MNISKAMNTYFSLKKTSPKINNLFSRTEQYFLHRGANTGENSFSRIYIRADTRKVEIRRKYQTLPEFFADTFSFWDYLFLVCNFVINGYNKMCLSYAISYELEQKSSSKIDKNNKKVKHLNLSKINDIESKDKINPKKLKTNKNKSDTNSEVIETNISNCEQLNKIENKTIDKKENYFRKRTKDKFGSGFCLSFEYIWNKINVCKCNCCSNCCQCLKKNNFYYKNADILNQKLDIIYYIKTLDNLKTKINYYYKIPTIKLNYFEPEEDIFYGYNTDKGFYTLNKKNESSIKKNIEKK